MAVGPLTTNHLGNDSLEYTGSSTADNDIVIQTQDVTKYDAFMLQTVTGAVDVFASLDGINYATAPLSLQDFGAAVSDPVLLTAAGRTYGFRGKFKRLRVLQNGATAVAVTLLCGKIGG
jgi:hypothetical protein